jgi:tRNA-(ms[2]io[6]A)-hydroxylase
MKLSLELVQPSNPLWVEAAMADFNSFLQDHANCERKASAMALSMVAKYPDRIEIIPDLIDTAIEELEHFRDVYKIMRKRNVPLKKEITEDIYVNKLIQLCRTGRDERFMDRLLLASIIECRGAERFRLVYEALDDKELKDFYHLLWASEAKHGHIFVGFALQYFDEEIVYRRLDQLNKSENDIISQLPYSAALH